MIEGWNASQMSWGRRLTQNPVGQLAQPSALDLGAVRALGGGESFERDHAGRDLVAGEICAAGGEDRRLVGAPTGLSADEGDGDAFAVMLGSNDLRRGHARLLLQEAFDLLGIDQESGEPERVAEASVIDETGRYESAQVAGAEKTIARRGAASGLRILQITEEQRRGLDAQLTGIGLRHPLAALGIANGDLRM